MVVVWLRGSCRSMLALSNKAHTDAGAGADTDDVGVHSPPLKHSQLSHIINGD